MVKPAAWGRLALLALLLPACSVYELGTADGGIDASSPRDGGVRDTSDGASSTDAAGPSTGEYEGRDPAAALDNCTNGIDDDHNGTADCEDPSCRANVPACCVGAGDSTCCVPAVPVSLAIAGCNGFVDGCDALLAWGEPFGAPAPSVAVRGVDTEPTLVPGGQDSDSGLLARELLDARTRAIVIEARVAASSAPRSGGADAVAVGLVDAESTSSLAHVAPAVGFMVSGNRGEVALILADAIVQRWPLPDSQPHRYALTVRPGGDVELTGDGALLGRASLPLERPLRAVIYGRTFNPSPTDAPPARIVSLSSRVDACDVPSALSRSGLVLPPAGASDPGWASVTRVASPSIARFMDAVGDDVTLMAVEIDRAIYLARPRGDAWELTSTIGSPALSGESDWARDGLGDPALVWRDGLELWFTGYANGVGTVARVRATAGTESFAWSEVEIVFDGSAGDASFAEPAPFARDGQQYVVLRVRTSDRDALALYRIDAGASALVGELRAPSQDDLFAFDRDELASPAVVTTGSISRLFFAGRRGLRWSIGVLVSPNGRTWYEPDGGAVVLEASGEGFDALGVRDPEPSIEGDALRLYYAGLDGEGSRIGLAVGPAPPAR